MAEINLSPYTAEYEAMQRRRRLAEAMMQQAQAPGTPNNEMAGGYVIKKSPFEGLAKMLQAGMGGYMANKADQEGKDLAARRETAGKDDSMALVNALQVASQGKPEIPMPSDELGGGPGRAAQAPTGRLDPAILGQLQLPESRDMVTRLLVQNLLPKEQKYHNVEGNLVPEPRVPGQAVAPVYSAPPKLNFQNTGGSIVGLDPRTGQPVGAEIPTTVPPATAATLAQREREFKDVSGNTAAQVGATVRGQDIGAETARSGQGVTVRGQDLQANTARITAESTNARTSREDLDNLRKEFEGKGAVKEYRSVIPISESARKAPDTRAGDIQMAYAVGKILDPNSVVREGELALVGNAATLLEKYKGELRTLTEGKGRLTPTTRKELQRMLDNAVSERKSAFDAERETYGGIAARRGYKDEDVFVGVPNEKSFTINGRSVSARKAPDGKYYVQQPNGKYAEVRE